MDWLVLLLTPLAGYLIGSIPFGYLVARARGVDIFKHGSGNIGATNVARVLGRPLGVLVFVLDFAKGAAPVLGAMAIAAQWPSETWWRADWLDMLTGIAAFLGHLFPVYLGFKGGKGVATGAGVIAVLLPGPAIAALGVWLAAVLAWRYVSLASLLAVLALLTVQLASTGDWTGPRTLFCLFAGLMVIFKHRSNISRLVQDREHQIRETAAMFRTVKSLHVLAVGLWFGTAIFFSFVVGLTLFDAFEQLGAHEPRPAWFPLSPAFAHKDDAIDGPKEQGTRAAGFAVSPMFPWYFLIQAVSGFFALATALPLSRHGGIHRLRLSVLMFGLVLVLAGWPVERYISAGIPESPSLRDMRNQTTEDYLRDPNPATLAAMQSARGTFGMWHGISLTLNLAAIVCIGAATALAAHLPPEPLFGVLQSEPRPSGSENPAP